MKKEGVGKDKGSRLVIKSLALGEEEGLASPV